MHNDFEIPFSQPIPDSEKYKDQLYAAGALYAAMTGSGSTIFGIFEKGVLPDLMSGKCICRPELVDG